MGRARNLVKAALHDAGVRPAPRASRRGRPAAELPEAEFPAAAAPLVLVACSGGPDSLALAAAAAFFGQRGDYRVGAVTVDHGLQPDSAAVAARAADQLHGLGLDPVLVRRAQVPAGAGDGPEAAARGARYAVLDAVADELGAAAVLLGHTLDDQAEQVLLGLARGSGTRSLAGMPARRGRYLRPFLPLRRTDTVDLCDVAGLSPWHDPTNTDPAFARSRARYAVLPFLEEQLGPGIAPALYRSARILGQDAEYLDQEAEARFRSLRRDLPATPQEPALLLPEDELRALPAALRQRVLALAVVAVGGANPSFERIEAAESLLRRTGSAGPVQLGGKVEVYRQVRGRPVAHGQPSCGNLVFRKCRSTPPPAANS